MICTEHIPIHFSLNRVLFLILGLWPYQQSKLVPLQFGLLFSILVTYILSQLGVLITSTCTINLVFKILFIVFLLTTCVVNYASFYVNSKAVKSLLEKIQRNYDELKDENEITILNEYGSKTKRYTATLIGFNVCMVFVITLSQFWPRILDIILPANESRPINILQFINEYFLDRESHLYLFLLHSNMALFVACITILSTGTMQLAYGQHICGMFRIASYRIQHAIRPNVIRYTKLQKEDSTYKRIIYAIDIHRKTLQFAEFVMFTFALWFSLLICAGVISTSLNLLRIFLMLSSEYNMEELIIHVLFLVIQYLYMFVANYIAQEVMDHNNHVFATVYNIQWYVAPLQIQKIILFLLQRGTKTFTLQLGGLFVGSLEGFTLLMRATISYFTVIYSLRQ